MHYFEVYFCQQSEFGVSPECSIMYLYCIYICVKSFQREFMNPTATGPEYFRARFYSLRNEFLVTKVKSPSVFKSE